MTKRHRPNHYSCDAPLPVIVGALRDLARGCCETIIVGLPDEGRTTITFATADLEAAVAFSALNL